MIHESIAAIQNYIEGHYMEELTLPGLSRKFYLSPSYLCELFKKNTGTTLVTYIMLTRIRHATRLVRETRMPLQEIAEHVGYPNYGYFGRLFKRFNHVSPEQYRNGAGRETAIAQPFNSRFAISCTRSSACGSTPSLSRNA